MNRRNVLKLLATVPIVAALPARQPEMVGFKGKMLSDPAYINAPNIPKFTFNNDPDTGIYCAGLVIGGVHV